MKRLSDMNSAGGAKRLLRRQIESLQKQKIVNNKVVSLNDFRDLKRSVEAKSILVVDDDEVMRNALKRILESEGYSILCAGDGLELSKLLETSKPDMVLLDINLPWVDGFELCRLLKGHQMFKGVPVVMVSARVEKADVERGFAAGCTDYVTKPFDVNFMSDVIAKHLLKTT